MADFVESAILKLIDQTSKPAKEINKNLNALFATAQRVKQGLGGIGAAKINSGASTQIRKLTADLNALNAAARRTTKIGGLRMGASVGLDKALADLRKLHEMARRAPKVAGLRIGASVGLERALADLRKLQTLSRSTKLSAIPGVRVGRSVGIDRTIADLRKLQALSRSTKFASITGPKITGANPTKIKELASAINTLRRAADGGPIKLRITVPTIPQQKIANIRSLAIAVQSYKKALQGIPALPALPAVPRVPRVPQVPGTPPGGRGGGTNHSLNIDPLRMMLDGFLFRLGYTIENAIITGFRDGYKNRDVADNRLRVQQLSPEQQTAAQVAINSLTDAQAKTKTGVALSNTQVSSIFAEVLPTTKGNVEAAKHLTAELMRLATAQIAMGESAENAVDSAYKFAKAGEQSGNFTDPVSGNYDPAKVTAYFDVLRKLAPTLGKDFTSNLIQQMTKYLRVSKFTLEPRGIAAAALLNEEMGSSASVGLNQAIKQLTGKGVTKEALAYQESIGLITTKEVTIGGTGGKKTTRKVADQVTNEEQLRADPAGYVLSTLIPAMIKQGFDPNKPLDAAKFAGQVVSDRTAIDALTALIVRAQEIQNDVNVAFKRDVSPEKQDEENAKSGLVGISGVVSNFISLMGDVAKSMDSVLIPTFRAASNILNEIGSYVRGTDEEGVVKDGAGARAGVVLGGAGLAAGITAIVGKQVLSFLNPLTGSAVALTGSATALNASAAALMQAAAAQGVGGLPGMPGAPGGKPGRTPLGKLGSTGLLGPTVAAAVYGEDIVDYVTSKFTGKTPEQQQATRDEVNDKGYKQITEFLGGLFKGTPAPPVAAGDEISALTAELLSLRSELTQAKSAPGGANDSNVIYLEKLITDTNTKINDLATKAAVPPTPTNDNLGGWDSSAVIAQTFSQGATTFDTTFATGSEALKGVGPVIDGAAAAFGPTAGQGILGFASQFGATAGAAIAAQVNGLTVNIKAPQAAVDTGKATPD